MSVWIQVLTSHLGCNPTTLMHLVPIISGLGVEYRASVCACEGCLMGVANMIVEINICLSSMLSTLYIETGSLT